MLCWLCFHLPLLSGHESSLHLGNCLPISAETVQFVAHICPKLREPPNADPTKKNPKQSYEYDSLGSPFKLAADHHMAPHHGVLRLHGLYEHTNWAENFATAPHYEHQVRSSPVCTRPWCPARYPLLQWPCPDMELRAKTLVSNVPIWLWPR